MAVNGGTGNQIKFSELQTYYGGQGPIHLSEYYRGGDHVPSSRTDTITNTGITALVNQGSSGTAGSSVSGNQSRLTIDGSNNGRANTNPGTGTIVFSATTSVSVTKDAGGSLLAGDLDTYWGTFRENTSTHFRLGGYDFIDASNSVYLVTSSNGFTTIHTLTSAQAAGTCGINIYYVASSSDAEGNVQPIARIKRGSSTLYSFNINFNNGGGFTSSANLTGLQAGDIIEARTGSYGGQTRVTYYPREAVGGNASHTFAAGSHALSFKAIGGNNNYSGLDATLNFTTSGTVQYNGFGGTFTNISTSDTSTTIQANTNIPAEGLNVGGIEGNKNQITLNQFNVPGSPVP